MHQETGEIKAFEKLTEAEKKDKKWIPLSADEHAKAQGMNRAQRRAYAKQLRRQMATMSKGQTQNTEPGATQTEPNTEAKV